MNYDDLLNRIEEEVAGAPASGPGSGVSSPGSEGATTEDNIAYLPSQKKVVRPVCPGKKKQCKDVKEDENDLPDAQQQLLDDNEAATSDKDMWIKSAIEDEPFIRFWLLSDGTFVLVPRGHLSGLTMSEYEELRHTGAIRISSDPRRELALDYEGTPNTDQILALQKLVGLHHNSSVVIEDDDKAGFELGKRGDVTVLKSPKDLSRILRGQGRHQSLVAQFHESLEEGSGEDLGIAGFILKDGSVKKMNPKKEHEDQSWAKKEGTLEYRFYPDWYMEEEFVVVRLRKKLTTKQAVSMQRLLDTSGYFPEYMRVEDLKSG
jgi:hypothetical protein